MTALLDTRLDGFLGFAATGCAVMILGGLLCAAWRILRGPTLADRVVALDYLAMLTVALLTLLALAVRRDAYLDAALALALVAFLATVAFARFLEARRGQDGDGDRAGDGEAGRAGGSPGGRPGGGPGDSPGDGPGSGGP